MQIRIASQDDLKQIVAIYNQAIIQGSCTADTEPLTVTQQKSWFEDHIPESYPIYVMEEIATKKICGWCSLSAHRKRRQALRHVAEISYYVDKDHRACSVGSRLMQHAIRQAPRLGLHSLFAILLDCNRISVALLERNGFSRWGHLPDIAEFPDFTCGQFIYGRKV